MAAPSHTHTKTPYVSISNAKLCMWHVVNVLGGLIDKLELPQNPTEKTSILTMHAAK